MPLDEMRLILEQWGNITGEPRGVDYTEVLGSWTPASNVEQGEVCYTLVDRLLTGFVIAAACGSTVACIMSRPIDSQS